MDREEHKKRYELLHKYLDELIADYIGCNKKGLSDSTLMDFMNWSYEQTQNPTEVE